MLLSRWLSFQALEDALADSSEFGCATHAFQGQKILVEFSSPNIAKPFHAGHLRSTILGAFLARLYSVQGAHVTRINYLGDWGKQYGMLSEGFARFGSHDLLRKNPIQHLFEVYVKINQVVPISFMCVVVCCEWQPLTCQHAISDNSIGDLASAHFKRLENGDIATVSA